MIWLLVAVVFMIIALNYLIPNDKKDKDIKVLPIILVIPMAMVIFLAGGMITAECIPAQYTTKECQLIAFLPNDAVSEGSFFLGSGTIRGKQYLFYCRKLGGGGWQLDEAEENKSIIHEEKRDGGKLIIYERTLKSKMLSDFYDDAYHFYIPENSIVRDYTVK